MLLGTPNTSPFSAELDFFFAARELLFLVVPITCNISLCLAAQLDFIFAHRQVMTLLPNTAITAKNTLLRRWQGNDLNELRIACDLWCIQLHIEVQDKATTQH